MNIDLSLHTLHFKRPARTSRGAYSERRIILLTASDDEGRIGLGECAPLPDLSSDRDAYPTLSAVAGLIRQLLAGREYLTSLLASQVISNVPAAVMLSGFTGKGTELLLGVNIGGFGTLIASLASLISFQLYRKTENAQSGRYMLVFSAVNFGMLIFLLILHSFVL